MEDKWVIVRDLLHVGEVRRVLADVYVGFAGVAEDEDGIVEVHVDAGGLDVGGVKGFNDYAPLGDFFSYCSVAKYHALVLCLYAGGVGIGGDILAIREWRFQWSWASAGLILMFRGEASEEAPGQLLRRLFKKVGDLGSYSIENMMLTVTEVSISPGLTEVSKAADSSMATAKERLSTGYGDTAAVVDGDWFAESYTGEVGEVLGFVGGVLDSVCNEFIFVGGSVVYGEVDGLDTGEVSAGFDGPVNYGTDRVDIPDGHVDDVVHAEAD